MDSFEVVGEVGKVAFLNEVNVRGVDNFYSNVGENVRERMWR